MNFQASLLDYQPLKKADVEVIKSRCKSYGMLEQDVDFSWPELRQEKCAPGASKPTSLVFHLASHSPHPCLQLHCHWRI